METRAKLRHLRISPRKVRLVVDGIRGLEVEAALNQLKFVGQRAAMPLTKLIKSAVANAEHNHKLKENNLYIKEIRVDEGPSLKRWRPRAFGRASEFKRRTSHISLVLAEIKPTTHKKEDKEAKKESKKLEKAKVVKSLDEIKQKEKEVEPTKVKQETKPEKETPGEEYKRQALDVSRLGKDRDKQHLDKVRKKSRGGALKRIFRRKSV
jgi:large subunit ribosomal protein L22